MHPSPHKGPHDVEEMVHIEDMFPDVAIIRRTGIIHAYRNPAYGLRWEGPHRDGRTRISDSQRNH